MSAGIDTSGPRRKGQGSQDFELNIASIIDCFTVLIAFMLASASFLSIGILDAGIAAGGATSTGAPPSVNVTVELAKDNQILVKLSGKATSSTSIPGIPGVKAGDKTGYDYEALGRNLASVKSRFHDVAAVTLTADNTIEYKDVVKTMEATRKTIPVVLLGGF